MMKYTATALRQPRWSRRQQGPGIMDAPFIMDCFLDRLVNLLGAAFCLGVLLHCCRLIYCWLSPGEIILSFNLRSRSVQGGTPMVCAEFASANRGGASRVSASCASATTAHYAQDQPLMRAHLEWMQYVKAQSERATSLWLQINQVLY